MNDSEFINYHDFTTNRGSKFSSYEMESCQMIRSVHSTQGKPEKSGKNLEKLKS